MSEMPPYLAVKDEDKGKGNGQGDSESTSDVDDWDLPLCYDKPRHLEPIKGSEKLEHSWRVKEKYKTHCVALVLCLNVGVDPPDVVKTKPCARLECWIDPLSHSQTKALENIGNSLQAQYERWQPRARYKQSLDPTSDEVKKLCCSLRRNAKDERVLFHYNGHGVPKPTLQGEIWVFNRSYTQYIPLSMYDLQTWMGAPSLYVYDCSNAGVIIDSFKAFADQHEKEDLKLAGGGAAPGGVTDVAGSGGSAGTGSGSGSGPGVSYKNCIQLAACAAGQNLPMNSELPADLFTACLTTPVKMAMKWFALRSRIRVSPDNVDDLIDKIPGQVSDRRTMLGELNWIFTAITDTIAWNSLPPDLFQQLFRADLLTASLCRNFLLADRIMRSYNCTPVSSPAMPSLASHPLWQAWDQTLDLALAQLPAMLGPEAAPYRHSPFFREQLTAFQVWLDLGSMSRPPPDQLPMVLQVLLSTLHRVRALQILCRFLALGAWAVKEVLAVGIFPYMLKLLQASAHDLRASMVYIWAKIIAADPSCQVDLVNAKGHKYFLAVLQDSSVDAEHRTLAAFVLAGIVERHPAGQEAALQGSMISVCLEQATGGGGAPLRVWACVALGRLWRDYEAARWAGARDLAHEKLFPLLRDAEPEVRAAAAFALGTFIAAGRARSEHANAIDQQVGAELAARVAVDASPLARAEMLAALHWLVLIFEQHFIAVYVQRRLRTDRRRVEPAADALAPASRHSSLPTIGFGSVYMKLWDAVSAMSREPHPQIAQMASDIIAHIANRLEDVSREAEAASVRARPGASASLPPSPNTHSAHATDHARTLPGHRRGKSGLPGSLSEDATKKPIVSTRFVEWAAERFARAAEAPAADPESRAHHEREWRRARNRTLRQEARASRGARAPRLDAQAFHSRCPLPPAVILFHPYDQHAAVASKDNFGIWDWGTAAKLCVGSWRKSWGRITDLAYLNAHEHALLAVASHSGNLAVYRPNGTGGGEPALVAAWRALPARPAPDYRPPPAQPLYGLAHFMSEHVARTMSPDERQAAQARRGQPDDAADSYSPPPPGTLVRWCAVSGTLALAGPASVLSVWDAHSETLSAEIETHSEAAATALWRGGGVSVVGFADGSVRAWDERAPAAPAWSLPESGAPALCAALRSDRHALLVGCVDGAVQLYDERTLAPLRRFAAPAPLAAVHVHPLADLLACGSVNQSISVFDLLGSKLNTIKFHEGFMGARIGPVSCLAFHPLRCALGVGSKDATVSVYVAEARR